MLVDAMLYFFAVHFLAIIDTCAAIVTLIFVAFIIIELRENLRFHKMSKLR